MTLELGIELDGALLDCSRREIAVMEHVVAATGDRVDGTRWWAARREGHDPIEALMLQGLAPARAHAAARTWRRQREAWAWLGFDRPQPQADALLARGRGAGALRLHVLASRDCRAYVSQQFLRLGWMGCVVSVEVLPTGLSSGPAAEGKARALARRGCGALIAGTESGALAAARLSLPCALVDHGLRSAGWLDRHLGIRAVGSLGDALRISTRAQTAERPLAI